MSDDQSVNLNAFIDKVSANLPSSTRDEVLSAIARALPTLGAAYRAAGWTNAHEAQDRAGRACGGCVGGCGGAGLRGRVEEVQQVIEAADADEIDPARGDALTWASGLLHSALYGGCGDTTCDDEHGNDDTTEAATEGITE